MALRGRNEALVSPRPPDNDREGRGGEMLDDQRSARAASSTIQADRRPAVTLPLQLGWVFNLELVSPDEDGVAEGRIVGALTNAAMAIKPHESPLQRHLDCAAGT